MNKKILITSALPYVNNVPHLGNIIGCVLSADVFARFCRSSGKETLFICGTDEHGTATETKAMEEGVSPKEICDRYHAIHTAIYEWFNISFDAFGRTTDPEQTELTQDIFLKLQKNGYITEQVVEQMYCKKCDMFLADRFVKGTCPKCGYQGARGDQCESCGSLLNATDLLEPKCAMCQSLPIKKESEHLFLDLPALKDELLSWIDARSEEGRWSQNAKTMTYAWIRDGLKPRAISRDLKWGVQIPIEKYKDKVFYVWFDAPIGYISITKHAREDWQSWWKDNENVRLYQFMGKDNIPFHTIIFPASLIGSKDPWTMLYRISSTEYLNYETGKFSKSRGEGVFGDNAKETGQPADAFRYYLLINRPEKSDSVFTWSDFADKINNELVANFGNLVNRTLTFTKKFFDSTIPVPSMKEKDQAFLAEMKKEFEVISGMLDEVELKDALKTIMHVSKRANQYFQESEPWKIIKEDKEAAGTALYVLNHMVKDLAILVEPFLPDTSKRIFSQLGMTPVGWADLGKLSLKPGHRLNEPEILFNKIEEGQVTQWRNIYGGNAALPEKEDPGEEGFILDLRVAEILEIEDHPDADKLYVMQIGLGEEKRQLVAGLRPYYTKDQLLGTHIVIVSNLKPAKLRGKMSQGMLLAGGDDSGVSVLQAPASPPGTNVWVEGAKTSHAEITYDQFSSLDLRVKGGKVIYSGKPLKTDHEDVACEGVSDGSRVR